MLTSPLVSWCSQENCASTFSQETQLRYGRPPSRLLEAHAFVFTYNQCIYLQREYCAFISEIPTSSIRFVHIRNIAFSNFIKKLKVNCRLTVLVRCICAAPRRALSSQMHCRTSRTKTGSWSASSRILKAFTFFKNEQKVSQKNVRNSWIISV